MLRLLPALVACLVCAPAFAADVDGATLPAALGLPFAGMLASIALGPLVATSFWHHHYGKVAAGWAIVSLVSLAGAAGPMVAAALVFHTLALEYVPFIMMLFALFTAAGGMAVRGRLRASPAMNTGFLALGAAVASIIGTTGASMLLIRPLLRANARREVNAHVVVFFIFLVANIGGALSPLGDPPLFLGFLRGVDFFWPLRTLWMETLAISGALLAIFFALDAWHARRETAPADETGEDDPVRVAGLVNIGLIAVAIGAIVASGTWRPGVDWTILGTKIELQNVVREAVLACVGVGSLLLTPKGVRRENGFEWEPLVEVAKIFAGIFICIVPVIVMLDAGARGVFAPLLAQVQHANGTPIDWAYFWMTGLLSSVLDNAPTYLVFFELTGGDAQRLMGPLASTLAAISLGAVFMGAGTYIGNAPNFMVYAIARRAGVKMPGFFGYILWSGGILAPLFVLMTFAVFHV